MDIRESNYAIIDLNALTNNILSVKKRLGGAEILAVVKANAYGHGAEAVSLHIEKDVQSFGVATAEEGVKLRRAGIKKPILILGCSFPYSYSDIIDYDLTPCLSSVEQAATLSGYSLSRGTVTGVHINVDTGFSRAGFNDGDISEILAAAEMRGINIAGIFSHYAAADDNAEYTARQAERFERVLKLLKDKKIEPKIRHISNSAASLNVYGNHYETVRLGILMYGLHPSKSENYGLTLMPAMSWRAKISHIKTVSAGVYVSYGLEYKTERETVIAVIPVGYADGYPRTAKRVLINGKSAPIIGRICMEQFMIDASGIEEARVGTDVTLLGADGGERITVAELSDFNYGFLCGIGERVKRVYCPSKDGR